MLESATQVTPARKCSACLEETLEKGYHMLTLWHIKKGVMDREYKLNFEVDCWGFRMAVERGRWLLEEMRQSQELYHVYALLLNTAGNRTHGAEKKVLFSKENRIGREN